MADNYLEKKFEEHLNAPYKPVRPKRSPTASRRVVVTGGAKGIGSHIVRSLRVAAHKVAFCDIDEVAGRETALRTGSDFYHVDVADAGVYMAFLRDVAEKWGGLDVIVNNVALKRKADILDFTPELFDSTMATDVRPVLIGAQQMACLRKGHDGAPVPSFGRIVNICSSCSRQSAPGNDVHSAAKGAISSLTHSLALSLAPYGITVNSISPGKIYEPDKDPSPSATLPPSGRVGRPEDVARVVRFIIEDGSDFINAENIVVDGGMTRKIIPNQ